MRYLLITILFVLTSCAAVPILDTINKRMAAFEVSFQETVKLVILYRQEGRFTESEFFAIKNRINEVNNILSVTYGLIDSGNIVEADKSLSSAKTVLQIVRRVLLEKERNVSYKFNNSFRYAKYSHKCNSTFKRNFTNCIYGKPGYYF